MQGNYLTLQKLISTLIKDSKIHICIYDISGILRAKYLNIELPYCTHTKPFCSMAKKTIKGLETCTNCKRKSNKKAVLEQKMFSGFCDYGMFEIVKPVVLKDRTYCIIYLGNMLFDIKKTEAKIRETCRHTKVPAEDMLALLPECQVIKDQAYYEDLANLIDGYIRLLYEHGQSREDDTGIKFHHWVVSAILDFIEMNYTNNLTLKHVSSLYYINPKYMGRIFKEQVGVTFHEYLTSIRLTKATELLINTNENITHIAMHCGFQNVAYFNRVFLDKYNMTPSQYRKQNKGKF